MSRHIGILQTDRVLDEFREVHGDYPFMFERLLRSLDDTIRITNYWVQDIAEIPACGFLSLARKKFATRESLPPSAASV